MNIGLIDSDLIDKGTNFPNLALMKLSSYYKQRGHIVNLINYHEILDYNKVFISKVFDYTNIPHKFTKDSIILSDSIAYSQGLYLPEQKFTEVKVGGTGFFYDKAQPLPDEIEHCFPDYNLYTNNCNHSSVNVVNNSGVGVSIPEPSTPVIPNIWYALYQDWLRDNYDQTGSTADPYLYWLYRMEKTNENNGN